MSGRSYSRRRRPWLGSTRWPPDRQESVHRLGGKPVLPRSRDVVCALSPMSSETVRHTFVSNCFKCQCHAGGRRAQSFSVPPPRSARPEPQRVIVFSSWPQFEAKNLCSRIEGMALCPSFVLNSERTVCVCVFSSKHQPPRSSLSVRPSGPPPGPSCRA